VLEATRRQRRSAALAVPLRADAVARLAGRGKRALAFGRSKINLHPAAQPLRPHARQPMPGSADLCFIVTAPPAEVLEHLRACGVAVEEGPVPRTGALGPIESVYFRDPDGNLIEVSSYARTSGGGVADPGA